MKNYIIKKVGKKGKGVFASKNIKKGNIIIKWHPKKIISSQNIKNLSKYEQNHTTLVKDGKYIIMGVPERYVNHSCNPNSYIKNNKDIALRDIKKGEEITSDYSIGVDNWKMKCLCGSENCRKIIYGDFFKLPKKLQIEKLRYLSNWIKKKYSNKIKKLK